MVDKPVFPLKLQPTYYRNGFFNVTVNFDRYIRMQEGPIRIRLGSEGQEIGGSISRHANLNGTARIFGGARLRDWFQSNYEPMDSIRVLLFSDDLIVLEKQIDNPAVPKKPESAEAGYLVPSEQVKVSDVLSDSRATSTSQMTPIKRLRPGILLLLSFPVKFILALIKRLFKKKSSYSIAKSGIIKK